VSPSTLAAQLSRPGTTRPSGGFETPSGGRSTASLSSAPPTPAPAPPPTPPSAATRLAPPAAPPPALLGSGTGKAVALAFSRICSLCCSPSLALSGSFRSKSSAAVGLAAPKKASLSRGSSAGLLPPFSVSSPFALQTASAAAPSPSGTSAPAALLRSCKALLGTSRTSGKASHSHPPPKELWELMSSSYPWFHLATPICSFIAPSAPSILHGPAFGFPVQLEGKSVHSFPNYQAHINF